MYDTVVAHGMTVGQLKQAILTELAEKDLINDVPLHRSVVVTLISSVLHDRLGFLYLSFCFSLSFGVFYPSGLLKKLQIGVVSQETFE